MAELQWGRTSPDGVARAEVRNLTPVDLDAPARAERADGHTYSPLDGHPGAFTGPAFVPPSDPILAEPELRERLAAALVDSRVANARANDAEAAHQRAQRHLERAGCALDRYSDVDAVLTEATAAALRDGDGELRERDDLIARMGERDQARALYASASAAADLLKKEAGVAQMAAISAERGVNNLLAQVLAFEAARIADLHAAKIAEANKIAEHIFAFNLFSANKLGPGGLPPPVRAILGNNVSTLVRARDQSAWKAAADRLRQDLLAVVQIE